MDVEHDPDQRAAQIAAALGDTARSRMLYSLMNGRTRTATELALIAEVTPSTASTHLQRLVAEQLVRVVANGKHRYYSITNEDVAGLLESLSVVAGTSRRDVATRTPVRLRAARTCYDHLAGNLAVALHDRLFKLGWLAIGADDEKSYEVTNKGAAGLNAMGIDVDETRALRRKFAFACLDWSERRPHVGGAIGAALLELALRKRWLKADPTSRAIQVTALGHRELASRFGLRVD
ncbi:MAG TPA: winged helix-turn-helix domain-containing protein [Gemmatimonadaceae bacterium]|jgi:DNA-binding transcriptional ArsR family regulator